MNLDDYQDASFRGVPFLVPENSGSLGRNNIEHLYPDSNEHYVEDNGKLLRKYSFPACIHGVDVKSQFLALEAVLEAPGPGTLLHPNLGHKFVSIGECNYDITQQDAGVITFTINCCDAGAPKFPSLVSGSGVGIGGLTTSALISMADAFLSQYKVPMSVVSLQHIQTVISGVATSVGDVFRSTKGMPEIVLDIKAVAGVYDPDRLIGNLSKLYRAPVRDDEVSSEDLYTKWTSVLRSVQKEPFFEAFDVTTVDLKTRHQTLTAIQTFSHGATIIHYCESASHFEYTTADQAVRDRRRLVDAHSFISPDIFPEAKQQVDEIVTETLEYLTALEVQLPEIEVLKLADWPVGAVAYQYYGPRTNRTQTLIDINLDKNLMLYDGEVSILRGE